MKNRFLLLTILLCLFGGNLIFAQTVNDAVRLAVPGLGSNARALGMGNAYHSLSDDASSAFFNPAGLGLLKRLELSGGLDYYNYNNNARFFDTQEEYSNSQTELNRISFAFPFPTMRGSLVFGLSYHTSKDLVSALKFDAFNPGSYSRIENLLDIGSGFIPYELFLADTNYNTIIDGRLNQSGNILTSGSIGNWTFSGAVEAARNFFIGANLNIITGSYKHSSDFFEDDTRNIYQGQTEPSDPETVDFQTFNLSTIFDWDISGWDAKLGFIYQLESLARFSGSIQFPKFYNIKENLAINAFSRFASLEIPLDPPVEDQLEYEIVTPFMFTGGFSLNYAGLIFSAEATLVDYSQTEYSTGDGISAKDVDDLNKFIKEDLRAVVNYNLGLEYTIPKVGLRLRGGYFTQISPYKGDASEFDRKFVTGGLGFLADETIGIDLAYAYGWWNDIGDNYDSNVSRTFQEITVNNFVFTLTYRF
jgi:long-subunit fatty acid transport protein